MELIQPRVGQYQTLWCEIPEVVSSGILSKNMQLNICAEGQVVRITVSWNWLRIG